MATERPAKAKRILVVEDEPMIRMLLEDMLGELGYTVAAEAAGIEEALEATKNADFDLAILDADLKGQPALPVADALVTRGTPFVFATGDGEVPEPYRGPADADEAVPNGWAKANAAERTRVAVSQWLLPHVETPGKGKGVQRPGLPALLAFQRGHAIRVPHVCRVQPPSTTPVSSDLWLHEIKH